MAGTTRETMLSSFYDSIKHDSKILATRDDAQEERELNDHVRGVLTNLTHYITQSQSSTLPHSAHYNAEDNAVSTCVSATRCKAVAGCKSIVGHDIFASSQKKLYVGGPANLHNSAPTPTKSSAAIDPKSMSAQLHDAQQIIRRLDSERRLYRDAALQAQGELASVSAERTGLKQRVHDVYQRNLHLEKLLAAARLRCDKSEEDVEHCTTELLKLRRYVRSLPAQQHHFTMADAGRTSDTRSTDKDTNEDDNFNHNQHSSNNQGEHDSEEDDLVEDGRRRGSVSMSAVDAAAMMSGRRRRQVLQLVPDRRFEEAFQDKMSLIVCRRRLRSSRMLHQAALQQLETMRMEMLDFTAVGQIDLDSAYRHSCSRSRMYKWADRKSSGGRNSTYSVNRYLTHTEFSPSHRTSIVCMSATSPPHGKRSEGACADSNINNSNLHNNPDGVSGPLRSMSVNCAAEHAAGEMYNHDTQFFSSSSSMRNKGGGTPWHLAWSPPKTKPNSHYSAGSFLAARQSSSQQSSSDVASEMQRMRHSVCELATRLVNSHNTGLNTLYGAFLRIAHSDEGHAHRNKLHHTFEKQLESQSRNLHDALSPMFHYMARIMEHCEHIATSGTSSDVSSDPPTSSHHGNGGTCTATKDANGALKDARSVVEKTIDKVARTACPSPIADTAATAAAFVTQGSCTSAELDLLWQVANSSSSSSGSHPTCDKNCYPHATDKSVNAARQIHRLQEQLLQQQRKELESKSDLHTSLARMTAERAEARACALAAVTHLKTLGSAIHIIAKQVLLRGMKHSERCRSRGQRSKHGTGAFAGAGSSGHHRCCSCIGEDSRDAIRTLPYPFAPSHARQHTALHRSSHAATADSTDAVRAGSDEGALTEMKQHEMEDLGMLDDVRLAVKLSEGTQLCVTYLRRIAQGVGVGTSADTTTGGDATLRLLRDELAHTHDTTTISAKKQLTVKSVSQANKGAAAATHLSSSSTGLVSLLGQTERGSADGLDDAVDGGAALGGVLHDAYTSPSSKSYLHGGNESGSTYMNEAICHTHSDHQMRRISSSSTADLPIVKSVTSLGRDTQCESSSPRCAEVNTGTGVDGGGGGSVWRTQTPMGEHSSTSCTLTQSLHKLTLPVIGESHEKSNGSKKCDTTTTSTTDDANNSSTRVARAAKTKVASSSHSTSVMETTPSTLPPANDRAQEEQPPRSGQISLFAQNKSSRLRALTATHHMQQTRRHTIATVQFTEAEDAKGEGTTVLSRTQQHEQRGRVTKGLVATTSTPLSAPRGNKFSRTFSLSSHNYTTLAGTAPASNNPRSVGETKLSAPDMHLGKDAAENVLERNNSVGEGSRSSLRVRTLSLSSERQSHVDAGAEQEDEDERKHDCRAAKQERLSGNGIHHAGVGDAAHDNNNDKSNNDNIGDCDRDVHEQTWSSDIRALGQMFARASQPGGALDKHHKSRRCCRDKPFCRSVTQPSPASGRRVSSVTGVSGQTSVNIVRLEL